MLPFIYLLLVALCFHSILTSAATPPTITAILRGYRTPYPAGMPEQIVVDHLDNVYTLDFANNHVGMFDYNGTFLRSFTTDNPAFLGPTGLAVDRQLNVYVADSGNGGNNRIVKFNANGEVVKVYGGHSYQGVAVDNEGYIYGFITSSPIVRMDQNGTVVQQYNDTVGWNRGGLFIDCNGQLLVSDMQANRALRFDRLTGALLNVWTTSNPPLNYPWNIASDCNGHVYIADAFNARVVELDDKNRVVAVYMNSTGYGVAISSKGDVMVAPGGGYNVAIMNTSKKVVLAAVEA